MHLDELRAYCLAKPGSAEDLPFGDDTLVFKVMGKLFALTGLDAIELKVNLKCDPQRAIELRERYPEVQPGYHMNKKHWNTVDFTGDLEESLLLELIDHSYDLVVAKLPKARREELNAMK